MPTQADLEALLDAVDSVLDDMGTEQRTSTCLHTKAKLRAAIEPFIEYGNDDAIINHESEAFYMPLHVAQRIIAEVDG